MGRGEEFRSKEEHDNVVFVLINDASIADAYFPMPVYNTLQTEIWEIHVTNA